MTAHIIDGKAVAATVYAGIKKEVSKLKEKPGLAVVRVGNDPASVIYVDKKEKACQEHGFYSKKVILKESATEEELLGQIFALNEDPAIHGILVQLPVPKHITPALVLDAVNPLKDVDGFNAINVGALASGNPGFVPATPKGIMRLLESIKCDIAGKHAVVVGRSTIVGRPVALLLLNAHATVTVCHSKTKDLGAITRQADILVSAVGKPGLITKEMVKKGAVVIDVGMNRVSDKDAPKGYVLKGDVDFEKVKEVASFITPVPGGVGPMTIAMLLRNTLDAYKKQKEVKLPI